MRFDPCLVIFPLEAKCINSSCPYIFWEVFFYSKLISFWDEFWEYSFSKNVVCQLKLGTCNGFFANFFLKIKGKAKNHRLLFREPYFEIVGISQFSKYHLHSIRTYTFHFRNRPSLFLSWFFLLPSERIVSLKIGKHRSYLPYFLGR